MSNTKYSPKLPLELTDDQEFVTITDSLDNVKQKLRMIILTSPGEKLMDPEFGVGINKYLFDNAKGTVSVTQNNHKIYSIEDFQSKISASINKQVNNYSPDIIIKNVLVTVEEQVMNLTVDYSYRGFISDTFVITLGS
jgi:phage baseplate assembly protein W